VGRAGAKERFDVLGFTFYNAKTLGGKYKVGVRTSKMRLKAKKQAAKKWLKSRISEPLTETMKLVGVALRGYRNNYGINGNARLL
jgi:RNA-directed DNA polymerase